MESPKYHAGGGGAGTTTTSVMRRMAGLLVVIVMAVPVGPAAQEAPDLAAVRARLDPDVARVLSDLVASARERGIPAGPLVDKALGGTVKRVAGVQIVAVLHALVADSEQARLLLAEAGPDGIRQVHAVAVALRRGAPPDAVRRLAMSALATEDLGVTVNTLADLTEHGIAADRAQGLLLAWRAQAGDGEVLRRIPGVVDRLVGEGVAPSDAATAIERALRRGGPPEAAGPPPGVGPPRTRPPDRPKGAAARSFPSPAPWPTSPAGSRSG